MDDGSFSGLSIWTSMEAYVHADCYGCVLFFQSNTPISLLERDVNGRNETLTFTFNETAVSVAMFMVPRILFIAIFAQLTQYTQASTPKRQHPSKLYPQSQQHTPQ